MSENSIVVNKISKRFRIGELERKSDTLAGTLFSYIKYPISNFRKLRSLTSFNDTNNGDQSVLWALKDISFKVEKGEIVGVIGQNGAGKSTLLKILSRVTYPTSGTASINGRVSSLLEVGTGFHPELTGRENIYLNGTILGMSNYEIDKKLDEIVDFSGIETFIDTPVKRYSSGMGVRLAFAIGAHLNSDIMIIDEVLAVGDINFQKRCMERIDSVKEDGRTVLFVSHNLSSITRLCSRTILLDNGQIVCDGNTKEAVNMYLQSGLGTLSEIRWNGEGTPGNEFLRLKAIKADSSNKIEKDIFDIREKINITIEYEINRDIYELVPVIHIYNSENVCLFVTSESNNLWKKKYKKKGLYISNISVPGNLFSEGVIFIGVSFDINDPYKVVLQEKNILAFTIMDKMEGGSVRGDFTGDIKGVIRPMLSWETEHTPISN